MAMTQQMRVELWNKFFEKFVVLEFVSPEYEDQLMREKFFYKKLENALNKDDDAYILEDVLVCISAILNGPDYPAKRRLINITNEFLVLINKIITDIPDQETFVRLINNITHVDSSVLIPFYNRTQGDIPEVFKKENLRRSGYLGILNLYSKNALKTFIDNDLNHFGSFLRWCGNDFLNIYTDDELKNLIKNSDDLIVILRGLGSEQIQAGALIKKLSEARVLHSLIGKAEDIQKIVVSLPAYRDVFRSGYKDNHEVTKALTGTIGSYDNLEKILEALQKDIEKGLKIDFQNKSDYQEEPEDFPEFNYTKEEQEILTEPKQSETNHLTNQAIVLDSAKEVELLVSVKIDPLLSLINPLELTGPISPNTLKLIFKNKPSQLLGMPNERLKALLSSTEHLISAMSCFPLPVVYTNNYRKKPETSDEFNQRIAKATANLAREKIRLHDFLNKVGPEKINYLISDAEKLGMLLSQLSNSQMIIFLKNMDVNHLKKIMAPPKALSDIFKLLDEKKCELVFSYKPIMRALVIQYLQGKKEEFLNELADDSAAKKYFSTINIFDKTLKNLNWIIRKPAVLWDILKNVSENESVRFLESPTVSKWMKNFLTEKDIWIHPERQDEQLHTLITSLGDNSLAKKHILEKMIVFPILDSYVRKNFKSTAEIFGGEQNLRQIHLLNKIKYHTILLLKAYATEGISIFFFDSRHHRKEARSVIDKINRATSVGEIKNILNDEVKHFQDNVAIKQGGYFKAVNAALDRVSEDENSVNKSKRNLAPPSTTNATIPSPEAQESSVTQSSEKKP